MKKKPTHHESEYPETSATDAPAFTAEARHKAIAQAAYLRAAARGFDGGSSLEDWLAAESEFETRHTRR